MKTTSRRIGPGHYEILRDGGTLGFLFNDVQAGERPNGDPEPWRFSPSQSSDPGFVSNTKRNAMVTLQAEDTK